MGKMSNFDLSSKIEWEGGVLATIEYGILAEDIEDEGIAYLWASVEDLYRKIAPLVQKIEAALDEG